METKDCRYIDGVGISGYRSFGADVQRIGPFAKINLFIGQNNSGKSNILRFLRDYYKPLWRAIASSDEFSINDRDSPKATNGAPSCFEWDSERDGVDELSRILGGTITLARGRRSVEKGEPWKRTHYLKWPLDWAGTGK